MESGINATLSSVKLKSQQIALYEVEILLLVVQNAENVGVREDKTSVN